MEKQATQMMLFLREETAQRIKEIQHLQQLLQALDEQRAKTLNSLLVYSGRVEELDILIKHLEAHIK